MPRSPFTAASAALLLALTPAVAADAVELETVAELGQPPGNVAVTPDGRIIVSQHQFFGPEHAVVELTDDGPRPFPNAAWASPPGPVGRGMHAVLGVVADQRGIVWMADNGAPQPRIVAWDTRRDALHRVITLPAHAAPEGSFPNDLAVDVARGMLYLADFGGDAPALIVVELATGHAWRVLAGHASTAAEPDRPVRVDGELVTLGEGEDAAPARVGVNPITIDPGNTWVYYGAMSGTAVYRVRAADLAAGRTGDALAERVERYGDKPVSDGITIDTAGNVYVTEVGAGAIGVTGRDGSYRRLLRDPRLQWPDGFAAGPDGRVYVTANQLHRSAPLNRGEETAEPPYYLLRFAPLAPVVPGR